MKNKLREEIHIEFGRKLERVEGLYKNELECLKTGYQDLKSLSNVKDDTIKHLFEIIKDQDIIMTEFRLKTKQGIDGKLELADFHDYSFRLTSETKITVVDNKKLSQQNYQISQLKLKLRSIEEEFKNLSELHTDLIEKWKDALVMINQLEAEKEAIIQSYEMKIK